jgi:hypothetical protein
MELSRAHGLACMTALLLACASEGGDVGSGGTATGSSQGGSAQGGSAQGGSAQGGSAQGGSAQGGSAQGGSAQGGSAQGGSAQGGSAQGGSAQGGSSEGGAGQGGSNQGGASQGGGGPGGGGNGGQGGGGTVCGPATFLGIALGTNGWGVGTFCDDVSVCATMAEQVQVLTHYPAAFCENWGAPCAAGEQRCYLNYSGVVSQMQYDSYCTVLSQTAIDAVYCAIYP